MIQSCHFNPVKDNNLAQSGLAIDLDAALRTGAIIDSGTEVEYNGIEDPSLVGRRVSDAFEAIDARNSVIHKELVRIKEKTPSPSPSSSDGDDLPKD